MTTSVSTGLEFNTLGSRQHRSAAPVAMVELARQFDYVIGLAQSKPTGAVAWGDAGASVTLISRDLLTIIERRYVFDQRDQVLAFLNQHPDLMPLLLEAFTQIQAAFHGVQIVMQVLTDPEREAPQQLGLFILVADREPSDALARLAVFDAAWWLDAMDRASGRVLITLAAQ